MLQKNIDNDVTVTRSMSQVEIGYSSWVVIFFPISFCTLKHLKKIKLKKTFPKT